MLSILLKLSISHSYSLYTNYRFIHIVQYRYYPFIQDIHFIKIIININDIIFIQVSIFSKLSDISPFLISPDWLIFSKLSKCIQITLNFIKIINYKFDPFYKFYKFDPFRTLHFIEIIHLKNFCFIKILQIFIQMKNFIQIIHFM